MNAETMYRTMKCGDEITVMHHGQPCKARIVRLPDVVSGHYDPSEDAFDWLISGLRVDSSYRGSSWAEDEGVEWLPGWSDENAAILNAVNALRPEPPLKIDWSYRHNAGKLIR